jgi:hypothetical protein
MSKTSYPRSPVGDGKFCYSGPNCRRHGGLQNAGSLVEGKEDFISSFASRLAGCKTSYFEAVENSRFVKSLSELKGKALLKGFLAHQCAEHDGYHVYKSDDALLRTGTRQLFLDVSTEVQKGSLSLVDANKLRAELVAYSRENLEPHRVADKAMMDRLQLRYSHESPDRNAVNAREQQLVTARLQQGITEVKVPVVHDLLYPVENVGDEMLLEYYQCGRKQGFGNISIAEEKIVEQNDPGLSAYTCRHCPKTHIGHGGGLISEQEQLVSAKRHWITFPEKSNMFAFAKSLI